MKKPLLIVLFIAVLILSLVQFARMWLGYTEKRLTNQPIYTQGAHIPLGGAYRWILSPDGNASILLEEVKGGYGFYVSGKMNFSSGFLFSDPSRNRVEWNEANEIVVTDEQGNKRIWAFKDGEWHVLP